MISLQGLALRAADEGDIDPTTGHGPEWGKAAPIALLIIVLLGIALVFLLRSMNKQMHKVPASFDEPDSVRPTDGSTVGIDAGPAADRPAPTPPAADAENGPSGR